MASPNRKVHAYVWSTGSSRSTTSVLGGGWVHVYPKRRAARTWHYIVMVDDAVILYDNTGAYQPMLNKALIEVAALEHLVRTGHKLKPYSGGIALPPVGKFKGKVYNA